MLLSLLLYAGGNAGQDASLEVAAEMTGRDVDGGSEVVVTVKNTGGRGAEDVIVEVKMGSETREVVISSLGKDEERTASVISPPGFSGTPEVSVLSYNHP